MMAVSSLVNISVCVFSQSEGGLMQEFFFKWTVSSILCFKSNSIRDKNVIVNNKNVICLVLKRMYCSSEYEQQ